MCACFTLLSTRGLFCCMLLAVFSSHSSSPVSATCYLNQHPPLNFSLNVMGVWAGACCWAAGIAGFWVFLPTSYHVRGCWLQPSVPWAPLLHVWCRHSGIHIRILPVIPDDYNLAWTTEVTLKCVLWTSEILLTHKLLPKTKIFFFMMYIIFTCVWVLLIHFKC